jgi:dTDP-4-dehydrorhamnose 3,5-epimerase
MDQQLIEGIELTPLRQFNLEKGNVLHGIKKSEKSFYGLGEVYFSFIKYNAIKAWKKHERMICNFVVPVGKIKFVIYDPRTESSTYNQFFEIILSSENYCRMTLPPGLWYGFRGESSQENMVVNIASIEHDPGEQTMLETDDQKIPYNWGTIN